MIQLWFCVFFPISRVSVSSFIRENSFHFCLDSFHFLFVFLIGIFFLVQFQGSFNFRIRYHSTNLIELYYIVWSLSEILNSVLMSFTCFEILACALIRFMYYCAHKVFADNIGEVSEEVVIMKTVCEHSSVCGSALRWISVIAMCFWSFNLKSLYALTTMLVRLHLWAFHPSCRFWYGTWGKPSISFSLLNWSLEHWCLNLVMWLLFMYWKFVAIGSNLELHEFFVWQLVIITKGHVLLSSLFWKCWIDFVFGHLHVIFLCILGPIRYIECKFLKLLELHFL